MNERCFARQTNGVCRAVVVNCPGHAACAFYKPMWKHRKDRKEAYRMLARLPMHRQIAIAEKYYDGKMPWEVEGI